MARPSQCQEERHRAAGWFGTLWRIVLVAAILVSVWLMIGASSGAAQDLPYGQVQAIADGKIQIKDRVFDLAREVRVIDNSGRTRTLADIQPGVEVEFRLQKGRIDLIVWIVNGT